MTERTMTLRSAWAQTKHYLILAYGAFGTMLDVGLMVLGAMLVGLAVAILLAGFGLVDTNLGLSTGAMLISAIVLGVVGLFCFGVASEGPLGRGRRLVGFKYWEVGIGRIISVLLIGLGALALYELTVGLLEGLPEPLRQGAEAIRAVGATGTTVMPLLGVPLSILIGFVPVKYEWIHRADVPVLFIVWAVAAFSALS